MKQASKEGFKFSCLLEQDCIKNAVKCMRIKLTLNSLLNGNVMKELFP